MYDHIIIPMALDHGFGQSALKLARMLMNEGGKITALHVYEAPHGTVSAYVDEATMQKAFAGVEEKLHERVAGMSDVTPVMTQGHAGRAIIDYATDHGADCIIMGSHKPGLVDYLLGSTSSRVVRHAPCAVHVLRIPT